MTTQEAYEKVRAHFSKPGAERSVRDDGTCMYRASEDRADPMRCAAGVLIPDELYDAGMEETNIADVMADWRDRLEPVFEGVNLAWLSAAQRAHDGAFSVESFLYRLDTEAVRDFGLTVPTC